ncbi:hypothetical protein ACKWTF_015525 [Chironomus riparius]
MKIIKLLISFYFLIHPSISQRPMKPEDKFSKYGTKFRGIECSSFDNSTAYFKFCYIKSYSRTMTTLNFGIQPQKKLKALFVQLIANFRYGNIYREVVDTKQINWCQIMDGADYNLFFKLILDIIRKSIPELFHKCPYEGIMKFKNITIDDEMGMKASIFPEGQYKYNVTIYERSSKMILMMVVFTEVKSPLKNSFG